MSYTLTKYSSRGDGPVCLVGNKWEETSSYKNMKKEEKMNVLIAYYGFNKKSMIKTRGYQECSVHGA